MLRKQEKARIEAWLAERCRLCASGFEGSAALFADFGQWHKATFGPYAYAGPKQFVLYLKQQRGLKSSYRSDGKCRGLRGIALKDKVEALDHNFVQEPQKIDPNARGLWRDWLEKHPEDRF